MKILKRILPVFLSAVIIFGCLSGLTVSASAAGKISRTTTYGQDGTAIVTLTPADEDNYITYTVDGTAPKAGSEKYTEEILVTEQTFFRVAEFTPAGKRVSGIKFTVKPRVAKVQLKAEYEENCTKIQLFTDTEGAKIYYTTNGTAPDADSVPYTGEFSVTKTTKIRAVAIKKGYTNSSRLSRVIYTKNDDEQAAEETLAVENEPEEEEPAQREAEEKPENNTSLSVAKDKDERTLEEIINNVTRMAETGYAYVTLQTQKNGHKIYYTTDGSKPTTSSKRYTSRIKYTQPGVIRAIEYNSKGEKVAALNMMVKTRCAMVEYKSIRMTDTANTIELTTDTEGADIYYSTDGSIPDETDGILYTGPITLSFEIKVRAVAVKNDGYIASKMIEFFSGEAELEYVNENPNDPVYGEMVDEINRYRRQEGLAPLKFDEKLTEAANIRAFELSIRNDGRRPTGYSYASVFKDVGSKVTISAEFRSLYTKSVYDTIKNIMGADTNRQLYSNGYNFNAAGAGHYVDSKGKEYWVVLIAEQ